MRNPIASLSPDEAYRQLASGPRGLSPEEARARSETYGKNRLREAAERSLLPRFLSNFTHLMAWLLWAGGGIALIAGMPVLAIAIWLVNLVNGIFSFVQEYRAERAIEALRRILPTYARVLREGEEVRILAEDLVPGDLILVSEGDRISADALLLESADLWIDQSNLSGEARPVAKDPGHQEGPSPFESNLLFAGTSVVSGNGKALVFAIGMETEFGRIAALTQRVEEG
ncbi:MAG: cation-transporting P-type ATPase [Bacteroidota bacterium]